MTFKHYESAMENNLAKKSFREKEEFSFKFFGKKKNNFY